MDLEAVARQKGDAWQNSAAVAAARMRGRDGFFTIQLNAADAATVQVRSQQPSCSMTRPPGSL